MTIADPGELFEHLDPSRQRHLDQGVEQFIVHRAQERRGEYALIVQMSGGSPSRGELAALSENIRAHFGHRAAEERLKIQDLAGAGTRDLAIGAVFLFVCAAAGLIAVRALPSTVGSFVEQGLMILGWVALWRPVDLFLYELRPLRLHRDVLSALSTMEVQFQLRNAIKARALAA